MKDRATTKWYRRTILFSISTFGIGLLAGIAINWKHVFHIPKASPPTTKISLGLLNSYVVMLQRNYGHANDTFFSYIIDTTIANQLFRKCGRFRIYNEAHDVGGIINAGFYLVGVDAAGNDIPNLIFYQPKTDKCPKMCDPVSIAHTFVAGKVTNDLAAFANGINLFRSRNADLPICHNNK